ncbi:RNA polymerase sigma factor [Granulicella cerasi]|uniref:RNA polymerase sigma factor n=1 Tax=Granulicella cerasi TaxID=741063 RepID=A0ABW1ZC98_9BACT|nr:sigma-70 family RNA polymerase sigma factor [Granulicella cerasi]
MNSESALPLIATLLADLPTELDNVANIKGETDAPADEALLEAVAKRDKDALSVLFRRHGRAVYNVSWRILRDDAEADDLRQETFLYLFQKAYLYDPSKGSASSWIIQVAYHRAIDRRRALISREHYRTKDLDEQSIGSLFARPSTDHIDGKAILERLRGELSSDQQQALELHIFEGYSFKEIAERNAQSIGNVRNHYYRALDRLRSSLFMKKRG